MWHEKFQIVYTFIIEFSSVETEINYIPRVSIYSVWEISSRNFDYAMSCKYFDNNCGLLWPSWNRQRSSFDDYLMHNFEKPKGN